MVSLPGGLRAGFHDTDRKSTLQGSKDLAQTRGEARTERDKNQGKSAICFSQQSKLQT